MKSGRRGKEKRTNLGIPTTANTLNIAIASWPSSRTAIYASITAVTTTSDTLSITIIELVSAASGIPSSTV